MKGEVLVFVLVGLGEEWLTLTGGDCVYIVISD